MNDPRRSRLSLLLRRGELPAAAYGATPAGVPAASAAPTPPLSTPEIPRMSSMVDLGDFNNPPPRSEVAHGGFSENAAPVPLPLPPAMPTPATAAPRSSVPRTAPPMGAQAGADDLNTMALAVAQGGEMPAGADAAIWQRLVNLMRPT